MKVITQLIRHFWLRGALSPEQAEYLLDQGFARLTDLPAYRPVPEAPEQAAVERVVEPPTPLKQLGERLEEPPRRRPRGGGPTGVVPVEEDLRLWLNKQFARRARPLGTLVRLAARFRPCDDWREAAVVLRQAIRRAPQQQPKESLQQSLDGIK